MATFVTPKVYIAGTDILAAEWNQNWDYTKQFINTDLIHADASRVFTSVPSGPATDPTSNNQFARKAYVDSCRSYVLVRTIHTSGSLYCSGTATDTGVHSPTFTIPAISNAHPLRVSLYVPEFNLDSTGSGPIVGSQIELFLYTAGHRLMQRGGSVLGAGKFLLPNDAPSVYMHRTFYDHSFMALGASAQVEVWGRLQGGGKFQMLGDPETPTELTVEVL